MTEHRHHDQVFLDPANKTELAWRVCYNDEILAPSWNSKGAALAHLSRLQRKNDIGQPKRERDER